MRAAGRFVADATVACFPGVVDVAGVVKNAPAAVVLDAQTSAAAVMP